jgi:hypothetical protein
MEWVGLPKNMNTKERITIYTRRYIYVIFGGMGIAGIRDDDLR